MTIVTGSCVGNVALMNALSAALAANGWSDLGVTVDGFKCLRAPGALAGHEFFAFMRTVTDPAASVYALEMRGGAGFDAARTVGNQRLISPQVFLNTWQNSIDYWIYINDRRVIICTKTNTVYGSAYLGLLLPFAFPTEYPKPFYVGGNYSKADTYNTPNSGYRMISDPGVKTAYYLDPTESAWIDVANHTANSNQDFDLVGIADLVAHVWPSRTRSFDRWDGAGWTNRGLIGMRPTLDAGMPNFAAHIVNAKIGKFIGVLDGVFVTPGYNRASEQVIADAGQNYRVFQNMHRVSARNFMSVKEV